MNRCFKNVLIRQGLKKWRACCTSATDCLQANCRVWKQPEELFNHCR